MRRLLITGRSGSIGAAIAARLSSDYDEVVALGVDPSDDVRVDFQATEKVAEAVRSMAISWHSIVLAHGIMDQGTMDTLGTDSWTRTLDINVGSTHAILNAANPKLESGASIVAISSTAGLNRSPVAGAAYTSSKWAVNGLVRHLSGELGPRGIRINAVCPGFVDNPMGRVGLTQQELDEFLKEIPLRRGARPEEVANVVRFLLSEEASYVSGALVPVSGGYQ